MPRGTRKTYIKKKNTRNKKNIRKQRRTRGRGGMKRHLEDSLVNSSLYSHHPQKKRQRVLPTIPEGKPFIEYDVNQNNLDVLRNRATQGDSQSQFELGEIYEKKSLEEPQYNKVAMNWYRKAADQAHPDAVNKVEEKKDCKTESFCVVSGGKKTAKQRNKRRRKTSTRRRR